MFTAVALEGHHNNIYILIWHRDMQRRLIITSFLIASIFTAASARGDLVIDVLDATIPAGGSGFVDVVIASTGSDDIAGYDYEFVLTPDTAVPGTLTSFTAPQPDPQLADPAYLFFGDSANVALGFGVGTVSTTTTTADTFTGSDATDSFADVAVTSTPFLLASLEVEHVLPVGVDPATTVGDTFTLSLAGATFVDSFFGTHTVTGLPGTVTLSASMAAIPEPGTILFCSVALSAWGATSLRRRRRRSLGEAHDV